LSPVSKPKTAKEKTTKTAAGRKSSKSTAAKAASTRRSSLAAQRAHARTIHHYSVFGGVVLLLLAMIIGIFSQNSVQTLGKDMIGEINIALQDGGYHYDGQNFEKSGDTIIVRKKYRNPDELISIVFSDYGSMDEDELVRKYTENNPDKEKGRYSGRYGEIPNGVTDVVVFTNIAEEEGFLQSAADGGEVARYGDNYYSAFFSVAGRTYGVEGKQLEGDGRTLRRTVEIAIANLVKN